MVAALVPVLLALLCAWAPGAARAASCTVLSAGGATPVKLYSDPNKLIPAGSGGLIALTTAQSGDSTLSKLFQSAPGATNCVVVVTLDVWPAPTAPSASATTTTTSSSTTTAGRRLLASTTTTSTAPSTTTTSTAPSTATSTAPSTTTTSTAPAPSTASDAGLMWSVYMYAVTDSSLDASCDEFYSKEVTTSYSGAQHYTLMRVCCDPTAANNDNCNAMPQAVTSSLWFGLQGGSDLSTLSGSSLAGAGPGFTATVAPVSVTAAPAPGPSSGSGGSGKSSGSAGVIAGAVVGSLAGVALIAAAVVWYVRRQARNQRVGAIAM